MDSGFSPSGIRSFPRGAGAARYIRSRAVGTDTGKAGGSSGPTAGISQIGSGIDWRRIEQHRNRRNRKLGIVNMALFILLIAAILVVAAIRNSQGDLFNALGKDVPAFVVWGAAIIAIGAIGFIKPLRPLSQGLLVLVFLVIVLNNYQGIVSGISSAAKVGAGAPSGTDAPTSGGSGASTGVGAILGNFDPSSLFPGTPIPVTSGS